MVSKHWKQKRKEIFERKNKQCEICGKKLTTRFEVHHKTYANVGNEYLGDLQLLCHDCHTLLHKMESIEKAKKNVKFCRKCNIKMKETKQYWICPKCSHSIQKSLTPKHFGRMKK